MSYLEGPVFLNGHRTRDTFTLAGPTLAEPNSACKASPCTATWTYDARDRLVRHYPGHGDETTYDLDPVGNVKTSTEGSVTTTFTYTGSRLDKQKVGANVVAGYVYDDWGRLECVTTWSDGADSCTPPDPSTVLERYTYDGLDRMIAARVYEGGSPKRSATYRYDALDRMVSQTEDHPGTSNDRTTAFARRRAVEASPPLHERRSPRSPKVLDLSDPPPRPIRLPV